MPGRPPLISVSLLSATMLVYEILLMHLLAIIQYHHFAYMIIGLALLGYGTSGTFLTLVQKRLKARYAFYYVSAIVVFSCSTLISFLLAQSVSFNGQELFWDSRQVFSLVLLFLLILVPFFFGAVAIGLTLSVYRKSVAVVYGADLIGAGVGSLLVIFLLFLLFPMDLLVFVCGMGFLAAIIALFELKSNRLFPKILGLVGLFIVVALVGFYQELKPSPYKPLEQYLRVEGAKIVKELSSPLGLIQVLESPVVPLRHAPGMSLVSGREPLEQKGILVNGESLSVVAEKPDQLGQLRYLDQMTSALPYHLRELDNILILGIGGGADILLARYHGAQNLTGVELNPQVVELLQADYGDYSGHLLNNVAIHIGDLRGFMEKNRQQFDLINLALIDSFLPSISGLYGLRENYIYTVEALGEYLNHLSRDGYLSITRWIKIPPRDGLKLVASAVTALKASGVDEVSRHLVLIRGWQTSTLLVKRSEFTATEISRIEEFCRARSFDIAYSFATEMQQVNKYNVLREPFFFQGVQALVGDRPEEFFEKYKFNLQPATDDRPYFYHFFKWSALSEILQLKAVGGAPLLESGYLILLTVLFVAVFFSILLIIVPLLVFRGKTLMAQGRVAKHKVFLYFFLTGIGFLFIEIAFIQKFILFLHHPVYAISITVASFLVFGGIGSLWSNRLADKMRPIKLLRGVVFAIAAISFMYLFFIGDIFSFAAELDLRGRIFLSALLICPLAISMGMPFPLALSSLGVHDRGMIVWAWGINGCSSVISTMLATILAVHYGFNLVLVVAVGLYLGIPYCFPVPKESRA